MPHPFFALPHPVIIGHRGAAGSAPENTLPSFERALELGAEVLESDIHVTRDGVPVLIHDPDVARTTGAEGEVAAFSFDELQALDAGYRFSPEGTSETPERGRGIRIPALEEAFSAFPGVPFNLEIKAPGLALAERVIECVEKLGRSDITLLTAGENDVMAGLRKARASSDSDFAIGACLADIVGCIRAARGEGPVPEDVMALQIPDEFGGRPMLTDVLVDFARAHEIAVHVWTINEPQAMQQLLDVGADGLVTDHPERMAELLGRRPR